jgi:hypothetical protein
MLPVSLSHPYDICQTGQDLGMILILCSYSLFKGETHILYAAWQDRCFEEAKEILCLDCWRWLTVSKCG